MNTMQKKHEREMAVKEKQKPDIERLERPQGEGGSRKKGVKIRGATGLKHILVNCVTYQHWRLEAREQNHAETRDDESRRPYPDHPGLCS
jgi:hypothetical protein